MNTNRGTGPVIFTFGSPDFTGANRMAFEYMIALRRADVDVEAVCGPTPRGGHSVMEHLDREGILWTQMTGWSRLMDWRLVKEFRKFLIERSACVVVSFLQLDVKIAGWATRGTGIPFVACAQNTVTFGGPILLRWLKKLAFRITLARRAARVYCCSKSVLDEYRYRFHLPQHLLSLLPNQIDLRRFPAMEETERMQVRAELGIAPEERLMVNVGRIDPQKGQDLLVDALRQIRLTEERVRVFFVGGESVSDPDGAFYREIAALTECRSRIQMLGWRDDITRILAAADLYVHPSRWEGLPLAVLEALSSGLPVIYSDCAGPLEGFQEGVHGHCIRSRDVGALRAALVNLLALPPEQLRAMGRAGRMLVEDKHDFRVSADRFCREVVSLAGAEPPV